MNGVLNILKPPHMTSHDVVALARGILRTRKIGHTGTLDPMAAGVLPICVGRATKLVNFLQEDQKVYRCEMTLGSETDTQDRWGNVVKTSEVNVDRTEIEGVIRSFIGDILQIPPMYSALKVNGEKLVDLARQGLEVKREPRMRTIYNIEILRMKGNRVWMDITCAKGTYIRTLCHDIGQELGCGAHMSFLLRTQTGAFTLERAITVEQLKEHREKPVYDKMVSFGDALSTLQRIDVPDEFEGKVLNGVKVDYSQWLSEEPVAGKRYRVYAKGGFLGIALCAEEAYPFIRMEKLLLDR